MNLVLRDTIGLEKCDSLRQQLYSHADAFLIVANKSDLCGASRLMYEISTAQQDASCLLVGAYRSEPGVKIANPSAHELHDTGMSTAKQLGAVQYLECNVKDPNSVGIVLGQVRRLHF